MENAAKALLIAGAILIAILLITFGILILRQGTDTIQNSGMDEISLTAFNQKFTKYEGKQKGSTIRTLVQEVMAYNNNENTVSYITVAGKVTLAGSVNAQPTYASGFKNTATYDVTFTYTNGRVSTITIN